MTAKDEHPCLVHTQVAAQHRMKRGVGRRTVETGRAIGVALPPSALAEPEIDFVMLLARATARAKVFLNLKQNRFGLGELPLVHHCPDGLDALGHVLNVALSNHRLARAQDREANNADKWSHPIAWGAI
ncbi:MAG: hypothetical protein KDA37_12930 [Planctomycetales bacterium]|nr:hypothetical protein [Planctomycetales bacterium]